LHPGDHPLYSRGRGADCDRGHSLARLIIAYLIYLVLQAVVRPQQAGARRSPSLGEAAGRPIAGIHSMLRAIPRDRTGANDRRLRRRSIRIRRRSTMPWLIVALLLFAASIVAALLQSGAVSAALALAAIAVAVASQLVARSGKRGKRQDAPPETSDDPRPANNEP
jgi:hypothetical protein